MCSPHLYTSEAGIGVSGEGIPVCIETKMCQALNALLSHKPEAKQHAMMGMSVWSLLMSFFRPAQEKRGVDLGFVSALVVSRGHWPFT